MIDIAPYARILASEILSAYQPSDDRLRVNTDLQTLTMSIDLAVPCGLILNELLSNAFKHAFKSGQQGSITVTVRASDAVGVLEVADDGVGVPADLNIETQNSLGLRLIRSLVNQIDGTFDLVPQHPGTRARVTFALEEHAHRS
ncbi:MAG TPA: sensor histidine kinase [Vicinamibacterales bacterium]|nr:sensor histidine kinase [Vicinamibacterales bacterium]